MLNVVPPMRELEPGQHNVASSMLSTTLTFMLLRTDIEPDQLSFETSSASYDEAAMPSSMNVQVAQKDPQDSEGSDIPGRDPESDPPVRALW